VRNLPFVIQPLAMGEKGVEAEAVDAAQTRNSALGGVLTQSKSRIGHRCGIKDFLGSMWPDFMTYAEKQQQWDLRLRSSQCFSNFSRELSSDFPCPNDLINTNAPTNRSINTLSSVCPCTTQVCPKMNEIAPKSERNPPRFFKCQSPSMQCSSIL